MPRREVSAPQVGGVVAAAACAGQGRAVQWKQEKDHLRCDETGVEHLMLLSGRSALPAGAARRARPAAPKVRTASCKIADRALIP